MKYFQCVKANLEDYCKRTHQLLQELDITSKRRVWLLYDEYMAVNGFNNPKYYIAIEKKSETDGLLYDILELDFSLQVSRANETFLKVMNEKELIDKASKMAIFIESLDENRYHCSL